METEQQAYEVPGAQWRWRAAQLNAQGLPFEATYNRAAGIYIVVVQQPAGANPFAYAEYHRPKPGIELAPVLKWSLFMLVLAMFCATLYMVWGRATNEPAQATEQQDGGVWDWFANLHLPWQQDAAQPSQPQGDGWQWPWDAAVQSAQDTVTLAAGALLAALVLLIVLALVRRRG